MQISCLYRVSEVLLVLITRLTGVAADKCCNWTRHPSMKLALFLLIMLISGCTASDRCQSAIENSDLESAVTICQAQYEDSADSLSFVNWITALGELDRVEEMENVMSVAKDDETRAQGILSAAGIASGNGDRARAHRYYIESAEIFRRTGNHALLADSLFGSFKLAWLKSDYRAAIVFAAESLDAARKAGDKDREIFALTYLFTMAQEVGNIGWAQRIVSLMEQRLDSESSARRRCNVHIMRGNLHLDKAQFGMASRQFELALRAANGSKNSNDLRGLHLNLVIANIGLARFKKAEEHMRIAWSHAPSDGSTRYALRFYQAQLHFYSNEYGQAREHLSIALNAPDLPAVWVWEISYWLGKIAAVTGNQGEAQQWFVRAIEAAETLGDESAYDQLKVHILTRQRGLYESLFLEYFENGKIVRAFEIVERAKSRAFVQAFMQENGTTALGSPDSFPYQAVVQRIDSLEFYLNSMRDSPAIRQQDPNSVLAVLADRYLISYFLADQRLFLLVVHKSKLLIREAGIGYQPLQSLVQSYKENPDDTQVLQALGDVLLPDWSLPAIGTHLYISPDAAINGVALASLRTQSQYLIERNTLSLIPTAGALAKTVNGRKPVQPSPLEFLVMGDPENDLPSAKQESMEIAGLLKVSAITGARALFGKLVEMKAPEILHLATHSGTGHLGPWLRFADRDLPASEVLRNGIRPQLAMLASCGSGAPYNDNLWGSLGGVFLSSGTPSTVVTLWSVEDRLALELSRVFYANYLNGFNAAESLAAAQQWAIKQGKAADQWGVFTLLGIPAVLTNHYQSGSAKPTTGK